MISQAAKNKVAHSSIFGTIYVHLARVWPYLMFIVGLESTNSSTVLFCQSSWPKVFALYYFSEEVCFAVLLAFMYFHYIPA